MPICKKKNNNKNIKCRKIQEVLNYFLAKIICGKLGLSNLIDFYVAHAMIKFLKECGGQFYGFRLVVKSKFNSLTQNLILTSLSSNISLSHFFICLAVGRFWQLRFEKGLKQTGYWLFRLTILKGHVFFLRTSVCRLYWKWSLLLGL